MTHWSCALPVSNCTFQNKDCHLVLVQLILMRYQKSTLMEHYSFQVPSPVIQISVLFTSWKCCNNIHNETVQTGTMRSRLKYLTSARSWEANTLTRVVG